MPKPDGPQFLRRTLKAPTRLNWDTPDDFGNETREHARRTSNDYLYEYVDSSGNLGAELEVTDENIGSDTTYPTDAKYGPRWADRHADRSGQIPLFKYETVGKPTSTVTYLQSTEKSRLNAMTMLGVAANDALKRGKELMPDTDLTPRSARLVKHLQDVGAVSSDFKQLDENSTSFLPEGWPTSVRDSGEAQIAEAEIQQGRNRIRETLRKPKEDVATTPQHTQTRLRGEGF
jgi:hypothetical protein